jgi:hypothetical protein
MNSGSTRRLRKNIGYKGTSSARGIGMAKCFLRFAAAKTCQAQESPARAEFSSTLHMYPHMLDELLKCVFIPGPLADAYRQHAEKILADQNRRDKDRLPTTK